MHLTVVGFNYKNTPLSLRERLAFDREKSVAVNKSLINQEVIEEILTVSTCNRTEIYCVGSCISGVKETIYHIIAEAIKCGVSELLNVSYVYSDAEALKHLFRVAASLDAMVVGEAQVLGQLKGAYQAAVEYNTAGPYLHKACHAAFRAAKRVRTDTDIAMFPVSIGTLAVELIEESFGDLSKATALIVGAGEMGELVSNRLKDRGLAHIWIANRTRETADALAKAVQGIAVSFDSWKTHMQTADIIVTSAGGGTFITRDDISQAVVLQKGRQIVIVDLAVPRNVDEAASKISGVKLYNIDDLQGLADKNLAARREAALKAEGIIEEETSAAFGELRHLKLAPMLKQLQEKYSAIIKSELEALYSECPDLTDKEKESIKICAEAIVKKFLHGPIRVIKEEIARPGSSGAEVSATIQKIFCLP